MRIRTATWNRMIWRVLGISLVASLLVACNLGASAPTPVQGVTQTPSGVGPLGVVTPSPTSPIVVPPTVTPTPPLLPSETLGPITVQGTEHRTTEPVTLKLRRGKSVSNVTCNWLLQGSNRTGQLGAPTSLQVDDNTFEDTYTFTPDAAGTYTVNCTGVATTLSGQRAVSVPGQPFAVEAKG